MTRPGEDQQKLKLSPRTKFKFSVIQYNCFKKETNCKVCGGERVMSDKHFFA